VKVCFKIERVSKEGRGRKGEAPSAERLIRRKKKVQGKLRKLQKECKRRGSPRCPGTTVRPKEGVGHFVGVFIIGGKEGEGETLAKRKGTGDAGAGGWRRGGPI